jgi:hypothetical protein
MRCQKAVDVGSAAHHGQKGASQAKPSLSNEARGKRSWLTWIMKLQPGGVRFKNDYSWDQFSQWALDSHCDRSDRTHEALVEAIKSLDLIRISKKVPVASTAIVCSHTPHPPMSMSRHIGANQRYPSGLTGRGVGVELQRTLHLICKVYAHTTYFRLEER